MCWYFINSLVHEYVPGVTLLTVGLYIHACNFQSHVPRKMLCSFLQESASSTLQGFLQQMVDDAGNIDEAIRPAATAAKAQVEMLGKQV